MIIKKHLHTCAHIHTHAQIDAQVSWSANKVHTHRYVEEFSLHDYKQQFHQTLVMFSVIRR